MNVDWISQNPREMLRQINRFLEAIDTPTGQAKAKLTPAQLIVLHTRHSALLDACDQKDLIEANFGTAVRTQTEAYEAAAKEFRTLGRLAQASDVMDDPTREGAGLRIRERRGRGLGALPLVEDLICKPRPGGDNFLDWSGPTGSGITYNIECRVALDKSWEPVGYTTRTAYLHESSGAGNRAEYRVVPQRSGRVGKPSNTMTAY